MLLFDIAHKGYIITQNVISLMTEITFTSYINLSKYVVTSHSCIVHTQLVLLYRGIGLDSRVHSNIVLFIITMLNLEQPKNLCTTIT